MELKKGLLWASIGAIGMAGLATAFIFLVGAFNEVTLKLIASTLAIGWFGVTASVATSTDLTRSGEVDAIEMLQTLSGWTVAILGLLISMYLIWWMGFIDVGDGEWKTLLILISLSFTLLWVVRVRTPAGSNTLVTWSSGLTMTMVLLVEAMVVVLIVGEGRDLGEFFFRLLATLTVLAVTGSVALPFMKKLGAGSTTTSA